MEWLPDQIYFDQMNKLLRLTRMKYMKYPEISLKLDMYVDEENLDNPIWNEMIGAMRKEELAFNEIHISIQSSILSGC